MSSTVRRLIYLMMGMLAGLASWPAMELMIQLQGSFPSYLLFSVVSGALFGLLFGAFFGVVDGMIAANRRRVLTGLGLGAVIGGVGGGVGFVLGQGALFFLGESFFRSGTDLAYIGRPISRALGWAILGGFVGLAEGVRARSGLKAGMGVTGGILGGLLGGAALEYASLLLPDYLSRPAGLVVLGLLIALFYIIVEGTLAYGRLRLLNGPFKGKEFILNERRISMGRAAGSDVYLPDYRRVAADHAAIREEKGELFLYPGEEATVKVNDQKVDPEGSKPLKFDDVIQLGAAKLLFQPLR